MQVTDVKACIDIGKKLNIVREDIFRSSAELSWVPLLAQFSKLKCSDYHITSDEDTDLRTKSVSHEASNWRNEIDSDIINSTYVSRACSEIHLSTKLFL